MRTWIGRLTLLGMAAWSAAVAAQDEPAVEEDNQCITCHANTDLWEGETLRLLVTPEHLAGDVHWAKGLKCNDCHGGNPNTTRVGAAHSEEDGFRKIAGPADEPAFCGRCHADAAYMKKYQPDPKLDHVRKFWSSAHGQHLKNAADPVAAKAANCSSCHPKHNTRPAKDPLSAVHPGKLVETCGACHQQQKELMLADVHSKPHRTGDRAVAMPALDCLKCHTGDVHAMLPVKNHGSSMFLDHQVKVCGECHKQEHQQYQDSVHGHGLSKLGLLVTASCSDCHGGHGIHPAKDARSRLHLTNVSETCGACHRFIGDRLQASVHGQGAGPGGLADRLAPGGTAKQKPSCTSCHQGHDLPHPSSQAFRDGSSQRCGNCHADLENRYSMSLHGQLADLGYGPAARCADCHGAHDVLAVKHANSQVAAGANRLETCRKCHPGATLNFAKFDPHADHHDATHFPMLHYVYRFMEILLLSVFSFFGLHTLLWFVRSLAFAIRHGRPKRPRPNQPGYIRFATFHRVLHAIMFVSFLGLALTGLPLKFSNQPWAQQLAAGLGGFGSTKVWHHACGVITFGYFAVHLIWLSGQILAMRRGGTTWKKILWGPDSLVPAPRDLRDLFGMTRWFLWLGPKPAFDRWTYWEKFDYWAVFWGVGIIGTSGLLLWFPEFFCWFLPGQVLNIAKVIHSEEALLATGFIFTIHFFNTHLRAEKFPMDMSMLTGMVSAEELLEERPDFVARMKREGRLDSLMGTAPPPRVWVALAVGGTLALVVGLSLLVGILFSAF